MQKTFLASAFILIATVVTAAAEDFGHYVGTLVLSPMDDGRYMKLVEPYTYVDPSNREWKVPAGEKTDGASVPKFFWTFYAPFTGNYRNSFTITFARRDQRLGKRPISYFIMPCGQPNPTAA
jgi:hypothetical protein